MARIDSLTNFLTDVASAIKEKRGITNLIQPQNFDIEIQKISSGAISNLTLDLSAADVSTRAIKELFVTIATLETITFKDVVINRNNFLKYTLLDYIQSTGTQYIDTLCVCDSTLYTFEMLFSKVGTRFDECYFGVDTQPSTLFGLYSDNFRYVATTTDNVQSEYRCRSNFGYSKMTMGKSCKFNDYVLWNDNIKFQHNENAYIFGANSGGSLVGGRTTFKLHNFIIYDAVTNNIVKYLLPILDNNNTGCLYDIIGDQLYYNQGTGEFITSSIIISSNEINNGVLKINLYQNSINSKSINDLFATYQELEQINFKDTQLTREEFYIYTKVEYLRTTKTQFLDTKIKYNDNYKIGIDFLVEDTDVNDSVICGSNDWNKNRNIVTIESGYLLRNNYSSNPVDYSFGNNQRKQIEIFRGQIIYDNTVQVGDDNINPSAEANAANIHIFSDNNGGHLINYAKLYGFYIYDTTTNNYIMNAFPVLDGNGTACLYDTITKKYYYNQGTGEFLFARS